MELTTVELFGRLKDHAKGETPNVYAPNINVLVRNLDHRYPGFKRLLRESTGIHFGVNGKPLELDNSLFDLPPGKIQIALAEDGSGAAVAAYFATVTWQSVIATIAINYAIGKIVYELTREPEKESPAKLDSYLFGGPQNTEMQGAMIPICYGRFQCGSVMISQELVDERQIIAVDDGVLLRPNKDTTINLLSNDVVIRKGAVFVNDQNRYDVSYDGDTTVKSVSISGTSIAVNTTYTHSNGSTLKWLADGTCYIKAGGLNSSMVFDYVLQSPSGNWECGAKLKVSVEVERSYGGGGSSHSTVDSNNGGSFDPGGNGDAAGEGTGSA